MNDVSPRIAILIPAHREASVIARKINNTHALALPPLAAPLRHLAVVIDDGSDDGTLDAAARAVAALEPRADLEWRVVPSAGAPGKGALRTGFGEAAGYDLIAMTDADSWVDAGAVRATLRAFADPRVGVVTGTQRYAASIGDDGPSGARADLYDRCSEFVRAAESRAGALFSVHGPWLVVRATCGVEPTEGVAADDLDLALQARCASWRAVMAADALFHEVKPEKKDLAGQRLRRAKAYFELMDRTFPRGLMMPPRPLGGVQWAAYWAVPPLAALLFVALAATPVWWTVRNGATPAVQFAAAAAVAGCLLFEPFYSCAAYAWIILRARASRHRGARADRWVPVPRTPPPGAE